MAQKVIISPEGRTSFMKVYAPEVDLSGKQVFSLVLLISKDTNMAWVESAWNGAAVEEFKTPNPLGLRPLYSKVPDQDKGWIKDGDQKYASVAPEKKELYEPYQGHWLVPLKCDAAHPPAVVGPDKVEIIDQSQFQSGDYARCVIELSSYMSKKFHTPQISVRLRAVQMTRNGERFTGGISKDAAVEMLDEVQVSTPQSAEDLF